MKLTNEQLSLAKKMHDSDITWKIIATYFKVCDSTLRKQLKDYDNRIKQEVY